MRDFMNYLIYIERSAENLQFFLWYRDYARRFAGATTADLALAPEWTQTMEDEAIARIKKEHADTRRKAPKEAAGIFKGTDFEKGTVSVTATETSQGLATQAFASAGVKAPCKPPSLPYHHPPRPILIRPNPTQPNPTSITNNPTPIKSPSNPSARNSTALSPPT